MTWEALQAGEVSGDVLANSTSVGMAPLEGISPVPASVTAKVGVEICRDTVWLYVYDHYLQMQVIVQAHVLSVTRAECYINVREC